MALDHYVSQVHLKQFYSPSLGELMYATKKSDLKSFQCNSKSVCRIEGNSSNYYLTNDRAIEDFLRGVEPKQMTYLPSSEMVTLMLSASRWSAASPLS